MPNNNKSFERQTFAQKATKHEKQEKKQVWEVFGHQQKPTSKQY